MKKVLKFILLIITLLFIWYGFNLIQIYQYSSIYSEEKSDIAIILGASSHDGKISPVFRERCNHAITLFQKRNVEKILVTGGYGENETISDSKAGMNYLIEKGIPKEEILIEEVSIRTIGNLSNSQKIMEEEHFSTALIVSDPLHMKRAMKIAEKLGINAQSSPTPTSMYKSKSSKWAFLRREGIFYCKLFILGLY